MKAAIQAVSPYLMTTFEATTTHKQLSENWSSAPRASNNLRGTQLGGWWLLAPLMFWLSEKPWLFDV
jgi:hypothetical protein